MSIRFVALESELVSRLRSGGVDANGQTCERHMAPQDGLPCRHCLGMVTKGEPFLILSHRPFPTPQPYAEQGPIFLHAKNCARGGGSDRIPSFLNSPHYIVRGYGHDHRIVYGSGQVVETQRIAAAARELLANAAIAYLHVRSATNNCYHCRIERA